MKKHMEYQPFLTYKYLLYVLAVFLPAWLILFWVVIFKANRSANILMAGTIIEVFILWGIYFSFRSYRLRIILSEQGVTVVDRKTAFTPWTVIRYAYSARDSRRWCYVILSANILKKQEKKQLANECMNHSRACNGDAIVLPLRGAQETIDQIQKWISEYVTIAGEDGFGI